MTIFSLRHIAITHAKFNIRKWADSVVQIDGGQAWQRDTRLRRIAADVVRCMKSIGAVTSSGRVFTPLLREAELASLAARSPACIQHQLRLCGMDTPKDEHLKHNGRLLLAQFLLFSGWKAKSIENLWEPKISIAYTDADAQKKEASRDIHYVEKRRLVYPYKCDWVIAAHMCPLMETSKDATTAIETCKRSMRSVVEANPSPIAIARGQQS
jgi:DNA primase large subunit